MTLDNTPTSPDDNDGSIFFDDHRFWPDGDDLWHFMLDGEVDDGTFDTRAEVVRALAKAMCDSSNFTHAWQEDPANPGDATRITDDVYRHILDEVLTMAKQSMGGTDAEFAYSIATDSPITLKSQATPDSSHTPAGDAPREIHNALYRLANQDSDHLTATQRDTKRDALHEHLADQLDTYAAMCRTRKYTGWSKYSTRPIQYAD